MYVASDSLLKVSESDRLRRELFIHVNGGRSVGGRYCSWLLSSLLLGHVESDQSVRSQSSTSEVGIVG